MTEIKNEMPMEISDEAMEEVTGGKTYVTVQKGDNLTRLAKRYKTTIAQLMKWNPIIKDKNLIIIGWKLRVK